MCASVDSCDASAPWNDLDMDILDMNGYVCVHFSFIVSKETTVLRIFSLEDSNRLRAGPCESKSNSQSQLPYPVSQTIEYGGFDHGFDLTRTSGVSLSQHRRLIDNESVKIITTCMLPGHTGRDQVLRGCPFAVDEELSRELAAQVCGPVKFTLNFAVCC